MTDLKQKLMDKMRHLPYDLEINEFILPLITILVQQREALEKIERAYPTSGERMAHQDYAKTILAATDEALKGLGIEV